MLKKTEFIGIKMGIVLDFPRSLMSLEEARRQIKKYKNHGDEGVRTAYPTRAFETLAMLGNTREDAALVLRSPPDGYSENTIGLIALYIIERVRQHRGLEVIPA